MGRVYINIYTGGKEPLSWVRIMPYVIILTQLCNPLPCMFPAVSSASRFAQLLHPVNVFKQAHTFAFSLCH